MTIGNVPFRMATIGLIAALAACDPGVHLAFEQDFDGPVDYDCIEKGLRAVAKDVRRGSYQADGFGRGFPEGTTVTQFTYSDLSYAGGYALDVARLPDGKTHYWHEWGKIGTDIPAEEEAQARPLLIAANKSVAQRCGLDFRNAQPRIGDG